MYPLRSITAKSVLKALSQFISIFGLPKVIQSDRITNFTSQTFAQILHLLNSQHNKASAYHPQSQGILERFHQTLKSLLRAYCVELGQDWGEGRPWLILTAREVTQKSTGFSPNALVFGHTVRGPLAALMDDWAVGDPPQLLMDFGVTCMKQGGWHYFDHEGDLMMIKTAAVAGNSELTPLPSLLVAVSSGESAVFKQSARDVYIFSSSSGGVG